MYCKQQVALVSSKKNDWSMTKLHERERGKYSTTNSDAAHCDDTKAAYCHGNKKCRR